jgi:hypothetical protein
LSEKPSDETKLPSDHTVAGRVIKLEQVKQEILLLLEIMLTGCENHAIHQLKLDHLTEKVDQGFKDMRKDMREGFNRMDRWMILLIGAVRSPLKRLSTG